MRPMTGARLVLATTYAPPPFGYARQTCRYEIETTASRIVIAMATCSERSSAEAPATSRTRMISSVAYADELIASELKMASALRFDRRSPISSSLASGRPNRIARVRSKNRPLVVSATLAAGLATICPGPV